MKRTGPDDPLYPQHIRIPLPKQCLLILTREEYLRGLSRGKAVKRALQHAKRTQAKSRDVARKD